MDKIDELLTRGVANIYPSKEALERVLRSGKKLRLYQGFDPSGIQLHIGHMTGLKKLRQWQELGHEVIFLIGDGTGQAGDPSGKKRAREKYLSNKELRENARDYVLQAGKIVDFKGKNPAKILYNGDWLNKLTLVDILDIASHFSLQQMEERDMFVERKKRGEPINLREFLYPLLQGYDSVAMQVDLELGGEDQTFNMLCGRSLVKDYLHKEKFVITTPLLTDSSGNKIGKTEGNVIALTAPPNDFYGMIMSLGDDVIVKCFEYLTDLPMEEIKKIEKKIASGENPMTFKKKLAFTLTAMLNSDDATINAQEEFEEWYKKEKHRKV
ncbi:MAG: tyrosine--tRNA ligase [Patescibacteria group bacterium]|nr:tyrosine--tRNA ligase [Patescibacteria group bacterium]